MGFRSDYNSRKILTVSYFDETKEYLFPLGFTKDDFDNTLYNDALGEIFQVGGEAFSFVPEINEEYGLYHVFVGQGIFTPEGYAAFSKLLQDFVGSNRQPFDGTRYEYSIYFLTGDIQKRATEILYREIPPPLKENHVYYVKETYVPSWCVAHFRIKYQYFYTRIMIMDYQVFKENIQNPFGKGEFNVRLGERYKLHISDNDDTAIEWYTDDLSILLKAYEILIDSTIILSEAMDLCESILPPDPYTNAYP